MTTRLASLHALLSVVFTVGPGVLGVGWWWASRPSPLPLELMVDGGETTPSPWIGTSAMPAPAPPSLRPEATAPTAPLEIALWGGDGLVLSNEAPLAWTTGSFLPGPPINPSVLLTIARKAADISQLPPAFADLDGALIDLYGERGKVCSARIRGFEIVAERYGETFDLWDRDIINRAESPTEMEQQAALETLLTTDERWLIARLEISEACPKPIFGRAAELPAPILWSHAPGAPSSDRLHRLKASFRRAADEAFRSKYQAFARGIEQGTGLLETPPTWSEYFESTYVSQVFTNGAGDPVAVWQAVGNVDGSCDAAFEGSLATVDELADDVPPLADAKPFMFVGLGDGSSMMTLQQSDDGGFLLYDANGNELASGARGIQGCRC